MLFAGIGGELMQRGPHMQAPHHLRLSEVRHEMLPGCGGEAQGHRVVVPGLAHHVPALHPDGQGARRPGNVKDMEKITEKHRTFNVKMELNGLEVDFQEIEIEL